MTLGFGVAGAVLGAVELGWRRSPAEGLAQALVPGEGAIEFMSGRPPVW